MNTSHSKRQKSGLKRRPNSSRHRLGVLGRRPSAENAKERTLRLAGTPEGARITHGTMLIGTMFENQIRDICGDEPDHPYVAAAKGFAADVLSRMQPRDAVEQLLLGQMLLTHIRAARLTCGAMRQTNAKWAQLMHEAADRAGNTFRRQILALAEYRRPPRPPRSFTAIGQANIAQQQLVQQQNSGDPKTVTNEQGMNACAGRNDPTASARPVLRRFGRR